MAIPSATAEMIATSGQLLVVLGVIGAGGAAIMFAVVAVKRRRPSVAASLRSLQRGTVALFLGAVLLAALGIVVVGNV
ncbi:MULTISPECIES: hypothetical protein [unclassified Cryobacterium]|uniref:hypothetical protein n=1 Tax=unclassified Cryobacterium TaxID=2649013 RepID=UPI002AB56D0D|nr:MULTISPECIES: hypothetical protein [unclassified Cryobacterium]MDY7530049.1 hypothetical protein [Cryobacterium sp. 10C2]MDY7555302.1 hypothetical protein [Cryobacterium sp. 10C3]MEB0290604.1 hypothetical protein [Cryobacterium sp. 10C2]